MGMYTELIFGASLKQSTPENIIEELKFLTGLTSYKPKASSLPFELNPLSGASYYFGVSESVTRMRYDEISKCWVISSRANIKNYENEIESFLEWIKPHIESGSGKREMYAVTMYEEDSEPKIYYLHD